MTSSMSDVTYNVQTSLNKLYHVVLREIEDETALSEVDAGLYGEMSDFIGGLSRQRYEAAEEKIKEAAVRTATDLVSVLLQTRLEKAVRIKATSSGDGGDKASSLQRLLDEEKFILDSDEQKAERHNVILAAATSGRSKLLESISESYKTGRILIRFLDDVDQMMGVDMGAYGPFKAGDVATVPYENAQGLIAQNVAVRVRWEDYGRRP